MPKKKEIEEEEVEDEDLEEEVEIKDKKFNIKKKIPKVDLNLQNLEFHQFMQPVQTESPVLEKIAGRQAGPVFIPLGTAATSSGATGGTGTSDEFKYIPTAEEGEIKYLSAEKAGTGPERVNIMDAGRHTKPFEVPKQESLFRQSSEAQFGTRSVETISARPEKVDPWQAGRKDDFEKEEKKYDPDLPSSR